MYKFFTILLSFVFLSFVSGQHMSTFADSIRVQYKIPELGFAVVSSDSIYEMGASGVQRVNTTYTASINDRFRIGSNTKAITGFIAALLVKQNKIEWDTKFFDLFPELKNKSKKAYHQVTLLQLLSFRTRLYPYTYTYPTPTADQFTGNEDEQRYQFTQWFFRQKPVPNKDDIHFSNLGYIAAGLMLEKASRKPYKTLVTDLGQQLDISFGFGPPNVTDTLQPWGHNQDLQPEPPANNYKLDWLLPAGNIHVSLPDYVKFIQLQLQGLKGESNLLSKEEFYFLHQGLSTFSVGWFCTKDENHNGEIFSYNIGNPGTFLTKVYIYPQSNLAFILFANAQTTASDNGLNVLFEALKKEYLTS